MNLHRLFTVFFNTVVAPSAHRYNWLLQASCRRNIPYAVLERTVRDRTDRELKTCGTCGKPWVALERRDIVRHHCKECD